MLLYYHILYHKHREQPFIRATAPRKSSEDTLYISGARRVRPETSSRRPATRTCCDARGVPTDACRPTVECIILVILSLGIIINMMSDGHADFCTQISASLIYCFYTNAEHFTRKLIQYMYPLTKRLKQVSKNVSVCSACLWLTTIFT